MKNILVDNLLKWTCMFLEQWMTDGLAGYISTFLISSLTQLFSASFPDNINNDVRLLSLFVSEIIRLKHHGLF